jgi:hypothetical protein
MFGPSSHRGIECIVQPVEQHTRAWLESFVVGLDLCPFAAGLLNAPELRITVTGALAADDLRRVFLGELDLLVTAPEEEVATILLVFGNALARFEDYLDFLDEAQALVVAAGLEDLVQLASFHPQYQFEGEALDSPTNYSNRSPYPVLHLLRENMLTRVLEEFPEPEKIPERNIRTLEGLGLAKVQQRWRALFIRPQH